MKLMKPLYKKLHLELLNHFEPIVLWWTDDQIMDWETKKENLSLQSKTFRIKSTPFSYLEFEGDNFISIILMVENQVDTNLDLSKETQFLKYLNLNRLPVPTCTFNEEFDFPISLIAYRNGHRHNFFDLSNYVTLNYLIENGISFKECINDCNDWTIKDFKTDNLTFIEYSKIKT